MFAYCFSQIRFCRLVPRLSYLKASGVPLNLLELAMPKILIKSRTKAFNFQQGRCIYCELPMWLDNSKSFTKKYKITIKAAKLFQCTAEHLKAKQDGGKDVESNIVAACYYCNQKRHQRKSPKDPISYKRYVTKKLEKGKWNLGSIHIHKNT